MLFRLAVFYADNFSLDADPATGLGISKIIWQAV